jgi:hypothetical protein
MRAEPMRYYLLEGRHHRALRPHALLRRCAASESDAGIRQGSWLGGGLPERLAWPCGNDVAP